MLCHPTSQSPTPIESSEGESACDEFHHGQEVEQLQHGQQVEQLRPQLEEVQRIQQLQQQAAHPTSGTPVHFYGEWVSPEECDHARRLAVISDWQQRRIQDIIQQVANSQEQVHHWRTKYTDLANGVETAARLIWTNGVIQLLLVIVVVVTMVIAIGKARNL